MRARASSRNTTRPASSRPAGLPASTITGTSSWAGADSLSDPVGGERFYAKTFFRRWMTRRFCGTGPFEKRDQEARELADINVAASVDRDAVRRGKLPRR